ncbi:MAG: hypothetical protein NTW21_38105 [Verrucomicrobia bacterium]|nr:hypothetical protein [Verrucomicrobiota bacterium]
MNDGKRYHPASNRWTALPDNGAPAVRREYTAVWTGSEMIVWGGWDGSVYFNDGAGYNPAANSWTAVATAGAPAARRLHTAVWTGSEMIVWGGGGDVGTPADGGGRYNPAGAGTWIAIPDTLANTPAARFDHTAVWTGSEMIVWGGMGGGGLNDGGRYNPSGTGSWTAIPNTLANTPSPRTTHTAVWTGSDMIVWGGVSDYGVTSQDSGRYNPATDTWTTLPTAGAPAARYLHTAVWTGSEMLVWGGVGSGWLNDGGRYSPSSNTWAAVTIAAAPAARYGHTAVWTSTEMLVWGGQGDAGCLDDTWSYTPGKVMFLYQKP